MVRRTERREKIIRDAYEERSAIGRAFEEKKDISRSTMTIELSIRSKDVASNGMRIS